MPMIIVQQQFIYYKTYSHQIIKITSLIFSHFLIQILIFYVILQSSFLLCQQHHRHQMSKDYQQMNALRKVLACNPKINNLLNLVRGVLEKYKDRSQQDFIKSIQLTFLEKEMEKIHIIEIEELLDSINNPQTIIALPLSIQKYFTLFFVIVPKQQQFNWHDHPKMTGFTKCVHGKLRITAIDKKHLKPLGELYYFPLQKLRIQYLESKSDANLSAIYPDQFNVHKIQALQISAFFDLLMPDYPDDVCSFFNSIQQKEGNLVLQKLDSSTQEIKGFDVVLKELSQVKKVQNIILK